MVAGCRWVGMIKIFFTTFKKWPYYTIMDSMSNIFKFQGIPTTHHENLGVTNTHADLPLKLSPWATRHMC